MNDYSFAMIKPDIVKKNLIGEIIDIIEKNHFVIEKIQKKQLTKQDMDFLYQEHIHKPFFKDLTDYVGEGPVIIMKLKKKIAYKIFVI